MNTGKPTRGAAVLTAGEVANYLRTKADANAPVAIVYRKDGQTYLNFAIDIGIVIMRGDKPVPPDKLKQLAEPGRSMMAGLPYPVLLGTPQWVDMPGGLSFPEDLDN